MTPIQWVAKELSIELRAAAIARKSLHIIAKEMGIGPSSLLGYIAGKYNAPEHVYRYCERTYQIDFSHLLTALRCRKSRRGYANNENKTA